MPIYEFECSECGSRFEKLRGISAGTDGVDCPDCGNGNVKRLMSMFSSRSAGSDGGGSSCGCGGNCGKSSCSGCHH